MVMGNISLAPDISHRHLSILLIWFTYTYLCQLSIVCKQFQNLGLKQYPYISPWYWDLGWVLPRGSAGLAGSMVIFSCLYCWRIQRQLPLSSCSLRPFGLHVSCVLPSILSLQVGWHSSHGILSFQDLGVGGGRERNLAPGLKHMTSSTFCWWKWRMGPPTGV
jgi:hypothetical protein